MLHIRIQPRVSDGLAPSQPTAPVQASSPIKGCYRAITQFGHHKRGMSLNEDLRLRLPVPRASEPKEPITSTHTARIEMDTFMATKEVITSKSMFKMPQINLQGSRPRRGTIPCAQNDPDLMSRQDIKTFRRQIQEMDQETARAAAARKAKYPDWATELPPRELPKSDSRASHRASPMYYKKNILSVE